MRTERDKMQLYAAAGVLAAFMTMVGDYLLEYTAGLSSTPLGPMGFVESAWADMAAWRFTASLWLGAFAMPLLLLGFWGLKLLLDQYDSKWAKRVWAASAAGVAGGGFIHIVLCLMPIAWKTALPGGETQATAIVEAMGRALLAPFGVFYAVLVFLPTILLTIATFKGRTPFRRWQMLLNPVVFIVAAVAFMQLGDGFQWLAVGSASRGLMALFLLTMMWARKKMSS